jgi:hypothetical protein
MLAWLARRASCTEGQVWTMATGLVAVMVLAFAGAHLPGSSSLNNFAGATPSPSASAPLTEPATNRSASATTMALPGNATPIVTPQPAGPVSEGSPLTSVGPQTPPTIPTTPSTSPGSATPAVFATVGSPGAPFGVAVGSDARVFVTTDNGTAQGIAGPSKVLEFDATGHQVGTIAISGQPKSHADGLGAAAVDPIGGTVYVVDIDTAQIIRIDPASGTQNVALSIPNLKPCVITVDQHPCEPGAIDHSPELSGVAFDRSGSLYIADTGQATIWRWHPGQTTPEEWYQSTDLATGDGPYGLAVDRHGDLDFTVGTTLDIDNPGGGALYTLPVQSNGSPGTRTMLAKFASSARPGALAVDQSDTVYLVVRSTNTIETVRGGQTQSLDTSGSPIPLDGPAALAVDGQRLLITNESPSNTPGHWAVLSFPITP